MLQALFAKRLLRFKSPAVTSRGVMMEKETWFVKVRETGSDRFGVGECPLFRGLGADDRPGYADRLAEACARVADFRPEEWREWSSICFGMETALADLREGGRRVPFPSDFSRGAPLEINGLVWMGSRQQVERRAEEQLAGGSRCLKLKIGATDTRATLELLASVRSRFPAVQLRVDANGAFDPAGARRVMEELARLDVHSIEQPIRPGQWREMRDLCRDSPLPVALDEELIGVTDPRQRIALLEEIRPRYIVLKPSLVGGFEASDEWTRLAGERGIDWWATSALESNIGLNAIAQWASLRGGISPHGLGTGTLYENNIPSPLETRGGFLRYQPGGEWDLRSLDFDPDA
ncbi:MAG: o-succinylbenzoate synthase [Odoribacteraceae bacterium]|jgi:o-succinylbenzoate synthase|nr:o-succinylbenzoate synthase [Odoribacteraceae bacterium]